MAEHQDTKPINIKPLVTNYAIEQFLFASSPDTVPSSTVPSTRRESTTASSVVDQETGLDSLTKVQSQTQSVFSDTTSIISEATAAIFKEADKKLEKLILDEEPAPKELPAEKLPTEVPTVAKKGPFQFECAFGFTGQLDEPATIPKTKGAFLAAVQAEIQGIGFIQSGLQSYQREINSRKYHTFSTRFLIHQNTATVITIDQLDQITDHLQDVVKEVKQIQDEEAEVSEELVEAFSHAQPWIQRTRRILYESHVFYKINYVLGADKKTTQDTK